MGSFGLVSLFTAATVGGLLLLVGGFLASLYRNKREWVLGLYLITYIALIHGTPAVLYGTLRYSWAYKHVGIVDYILRTGTVDPTIGVGEIYHNWPGFFAASALLTSLAGSPDALRIATWAPVVFNLMNLVVLRYVYRGLTRSKRLIWLALFFFFIINWVGQDYFSPQAMAYVLYLACIGLLAVWQVASLALKNDSFPTAIEAIRTIPDILGDKESLINILASLRRMAIGFGIAVLVSIPLGLLMGRSRAIAAFFNPLLMVIYPVPKAALMPIIMLWLGVGDITKTLVIFLGVSLPVIYHSFEGARAVEEKMLWSGAAMGLSAAQRLVRIVLPAALPEILTGCRTGLVLALITMITSEMIARQSGAGNILFNALDMGQYDTVFAMIIIVGAMGICLDAIFERIRARLVRWSEPQFDMPLSFS